MSFFGKFKPGSGPSGQTPTTPGKKDPNLPQLTSLEKRLATINGPIRADGSDKFFGFENYGSTCYCNSIIQCLYYSEPFREHVINFPSRAFLDDLHAKKPNGVLPASEANSVTPYPNVNSPARKVNPPTSPGPGAARPEDSKESPEFRKKMALSMGPVLDMTYDNSNSYGMDESLFTSLRDIFKAIVAHKSRIGVVSPHRFLEILRRENEMFRSAMHQDAHEFLNLLLNQVVDNVELFSKQNPIPSLPYTNGAAPENFDHQLTTALDGTAARQATAHDAHWVHDLFEGTLTSETRCLNCENVSQRDEPFLDLSLDLEPNASVTACLRRFSMEEMLQERNKFHCDNCGGLHEAEKRMKVKRLPQILALHLKRFKYTEDLQRLHKLFHRTVYPFFLRLFNTSHDAEDPDRLYELYAVVVHIGGGPYHGHYVSIIKTKDRGWLLFDDELVEPVDKSYVQGFFGGEGAPGTQDTRQLACAYVLFYQATTEAAMQEELEAEGQPSASRVSDAETVKDGFSPVKNGYELNHIATAATPIVEDVDTMNPLAHATTSPTSPLGGVRATFDPLAPSAMTPVLPAKTKKELKQEEKELKQEEKELKQEEKERKAKEKEDKKAELKAAEEKRKAATAKRLEDLKRQNDEMSAAVEASKQSVVEDSERRGDDAARRKGLARFRNGSISLRGRPKMFGNGKGKEKEKVSPVRPMENGESSAAGAAREAEESTTWPKLFGNGKGKEKEKLSIVQPMENGESSAAGAARGAEETTALPTLPPASSPTNGEEKPKKNRFSLGRKKSTTKF